MEQWEIDRNIRVFAATNHVPVGCCRAIPKCELVNGITYRGECRNASEAIWDVDKFVYIRHKFGCSYPEEINHFEDDDGYDCFVPIEIIKETSTEEKCTENEK